MGGTHPKAFHPEKIKAIAFFKWITMVLSRDLQGSDG
jgi:hypothetical protein